MTDGGGDLKGWWSKHKGQYPDLTTIPRNIAYVQYTYMS